jgi:RNA recognition motif-containing protein
METGMQNDNRLFVGSLSYNTTDESLGEFFGGAGTVVSSKIIMDRETNRSRGFGFVEMTTPAEAEEAIKQYHNAEMDGRRITVNIAKAQADRPARPRY